MSKEEKDKVDIKGIATVFNNVMFGMALIYDYGYFISHKLKKPTIENISFFGAILIGIPKAVENNFVVPMEMSGKTMKGYIFVTEEGHKSNKDLSYWIQLCLDFNPFAKSSKKK
ncbi:TfoX/Sxy family protein [Flavobacterium sp.]|uniref:TfoX/Sxy family protein n=1 Tax=Flavobacterium sp. TaxID=239 RepID=UPI003D6AB1B9